MNKLVPMAIMASLALAACGSSKDSSSPAQKLAITTKDFSLRLDGSGLRPGPLDISALNKGKQAHGVLLGRINDGVDAKTVTSTITKDPTKALTMFSLAGGMPALPAGGTAWKARTTLRTGTYIVIDTGSGTDGKANYTKPGEVQTLPGQRQRAQRCRGQERRRRRSQGLCASTCPRASPPRGRCGSATRVMTTMSCCSSTFPTRRPAPRTSGSSARASRSSSSPIRSRCWPRPDPGRHRPSRSTSRRAHYIAYCAYRERQEQGQAPRGARDGPAGRRSPSSYAEAVATSVLPGSSTPPSGRVNGSRRSSSASRKRVWSAGERPRSSAPPAGDRSTCVSKTSSRDG